MYVVSQFRFQFIPFSFRYRKVVGKFPWKFRILMSNFSVSDVLKSRCAESPPEASEAAIGKLFERFKIALQIPFSEWYFWATKRNVTEKCGSVRTSPTLPKKTNPFTKIKLNVGNCWFQRWVKSYCLRKRPYSCKEGSTRPAEHLHGWSTSWHTSHTYR